MAKFQKGNPGGPGRPPGPTKSTLICRDMIEEVAIRMGGVDGMFEWAKKNPGEFYTKVLPKLLPINIQGAFHNRVDISDAKDRLAFLLDGLVVAKEKEEVIGGSEPRTGGRDYPQLVHVGANGSTPTDG